MSRQLSSHSLPTDPNSQDSPISLANNPQNVADNPASSLPKLIKISALILIIIFAFSLIMNSKKKSQRTITSKNDADFTFFVYCPEIWRNKTKQNIMIYQQSLKGKSDNLRRLSLEEFQNYASITLQPKYMDNYDPNLTYVVQIKSMPNQSNLSMSILKYCGITRQFYGSCQDAQFSPLHLIRL